MNTPDSLLDFINPAHPLDTVAEGFLRLFDDLAGQRPEGVARLDGWYQAGRTLLARTAWLLDRPDVVDRHIVLARLLYAHRGPKAFTAMVSALIEVTHLPYEASTEQTRKRWDTLSRSLTLLHPEDNLDAMVSYRTIDRIIKEQGEGKRWPGQSYGEYLAHAGPTVESALHAIALGMEAVDQGSSGYAVRRELLELYDPPKGDQIDARWAVHMARHALTLPREEGIRALWRTFLPLKRDLPAEEFEALWPFSMEWGDMALAGRPWLGKDFSEWAEKRIVRDEKTRLEAVSAPASPRIPGRRL